MQIEGDAHAHVLSAFYGDAPTASGVDAGAAQSWVGVSLVRLLGAALACPGLIVWCACGITNPEAQAAIARGVQYGGVVGFFVALAQEAAVVHTVAGAAMVVVLLALVTCVVCWRVHNTKADPYGAIAVGV